MMCLLLTLMLSTWILFDIHLLMRTLMGVIVGKFFRSKLKLLDTSTIYGIVLPSDFDYTLDHMNNSRVVREFDLGRIDFGTRTGVFESALKTGGAFPINANLIRYRLPIRLFSLYKVETRITCWETSLLYMEQKLITVNDGIVRAVAYPKVSFHNCTLSRILQEVSPKTPSPEFDDTVKSVNDACDIISNRFKKCN